MLPQLEHSLRRMYATVNEMPERVQTAESAEFYTTFNEVCSATNPCIMHLHFYESNNFNMRPVSVADNSIDRRFVLLDIVT